jgi:UDP-N-acetylmuramoyl-L-alanyl-D-glutamate--2,6-diaminopimelate ligase
VHTTPESTVIQKMLCEMKDQDIETAVMEVSSHAIDMYRVEDLSFDLAIFTNLTPEHLDYHKSMELYFESKKKLFTRYLPQGKGIKRAVINADDPYGQQLLEILPRSSVWTYSIKAQSKWDLFAREWSMNLGGLRGTLSTPAGTTEFSSPLIGSFNLSNILASVGAALSFDIPLNTIVDSIKNFSEVPGRLERIANEKGCHIFVDYAHTPDALKNVLQTLRELNPAKIITVFGCGGDRDRTKRPMMGREAARFSDLVIVTSDNPRTEDPQKIVQDILPGIQEGGMVLQQDCRVELDRRSAIKLALSKVGKGEVLLIAGKGHEDYQILGTKKIHFDDRETVRELLKEL